MRPGGFIGFLDYRFSLHPACPSCSVRCALRTSPGGLGGEWTERHDRIREPRRRLGIPVRGDIAVEIDQVLFSLWRENGAGRHTVGDCSAARRALTAPDETVLVGSATVAS